MAVLAHRIRDFNGPYLLQLLRSQSPSHYDYFTTRSTATQYGQKGSGAPQNHGGIVHEIHCTMTNALEYHIVN